MRVRHLFLFLIPLLNACGGSDPVTVEAQDVSLIFFRPFEAGQYVFRSQSELDSAWAATPFRIFPIGLISSEPAKPVYDFSTQMVVGISNGIGKWCFKPNINKVERDGSDTTVHYSSKTSSTLACLRDGPQIAFALIPRADGAVAFVQEPPSQP